MPEKLWPPDEDAIEALASRQDDPAEPSEALA
jgi:hypothetical protein